MVFEEKPVRLVRLSVAEFRGFAREVAFVSIPMLLCYLV